MPSSRRGGKRVDLPNRVTCRLRRRCAIWFLPMRFPLPLSASDNDLLATQPPGSRLPTLRCRPAVGCPPYICRHVLAFSSNLLGSITHRGGRDARVPVRRRFAAIGGCADVVRFGFADAFWRSSCRLAPTQPPGSRLPTLRYRSANGRIPYVTVPQMVGC
ncbi:MAG: hypothetical protein LBQ66_03070 [Planctomycetaceae bacterium]|nr:hypothetical protein [Planctomycetaceae bacterium]